MWVWSADRMSLLQPAVSVEQRLAFGVLVGVYTHCCATVRLPASCDTEHSSERAARDKLLVVLSFGERSV